MPENIAIKKRGKQRKIDSVGKLTDKFKKAKAVFMTDYRGLTHQQMETLRKSLKKAEGDFVVAKNTLLKRALKEWNSEIVPKFEETLKNPTAALFAYGDEILSIKEISAFIKINQLPKIKLGVFSGNVATEADFNRLATLPGRNVLLATLVSRMNGPLYGLHYALSGNIRKLVTALNNVKEKKPAA